MDFLTNTVLAIVYAKVDPDARFFDRQIVNVDPRGIDYQPPGHCHDLSVALSG